MVVVDSNSINVTGEFITNSTARGCFLVLRSEDGSPDAFRALLRSQPDSALMGTIDDLVSSTYTLLVYDLEQSGLPNIHPAYEVNNNFTVNRTGKGLIKLA